MRIREYMQEGKYMSSDNRTNYTKHGDIRITGKNLATADIMFKLSQICGRLNIENLKVLDIKISLTFSDLVDGPEEMIIDSEDFDRITGSKYIQDENRKHIIEYLRVISYDIMTSEETTGFIKHFLDMYNSMDSESKFIPPDDPEKFCLEDEPLDINQYFKFEHIPYKLRSIHNGKYQLVQEHLSEYSGKGANLWGKLKSGAGWISLDYTEKT